jgi:hypothetical protein
MDQDYETLMEELERYKQEKEKIRQIVGAIGGREQSKANKWINIILIISMIGLFSVAILHHIFHLNVFLPATFYIEVGMLLISLKIIWMVHNQMKVDHFQFWVLNSIEFRLVAMAKRMAKIEKLFNNENVSEQ